MFGNGPNFQVNGPPTVNTVTTSFTGGPWTFTRTAQASAAETIATFKISDDATGKLEVNNWTTTDNVFLPEIKGTAQGNNPALLLRAAGTSDGVAGGANAVMRVVCQNTAGNAITTRDLMAIYDGGSIVLGLLPLNSGANSCLSWGTQAGAAPAFTTRSNGTRLVLYSLIGASDVDHAFGINSTTSFWRSIPRATSTYNHLWYGGTTPLMILRGDTILNIGSTTFSSRLGQKIETNTSANYGGASFNTWSATAAEGNLIDICRSKSATIGTYSTLASGDHIGTIVFRGAGGSAFFNAAAIVVETDGTPGATSDMPGRLIFQTTPDGSGTLAERMRITNAGDVGVGKTPTTGIILDLNGVLGLKSYTVGTLPSAATQAGGAVYVSDAAGSPCIALSNGTNWKRCDDCTVTVT